MRLTLQNVRGVLDSQDDVIQLSFVYKDEPPKYWEVKKAIDLTLSTGRFITIEEGFVTDLSSVPRVLWGIAPPFGDFLLAALIHDYLYTNNVGTRKEADREMLLWSDALNPNHLDNHVRFLAVRLFGKKWWKEAGQRIKNNTPQTVNS